MLKILKYIIVIIILIIIIIIKIIIINLFINFALNFFNTNIKVYKLNNLNKYKKLKLIIMSNHLCGLDYGVIIHTINFHTNYHKKIHTIVKHNVFGDKTDASIVSNCLGLFKDRTYDFFNFIPYVRDDKDSGEKIKKQMLKVINDYSTILLFPEGTSTRSGIPTEFKSGSFRLCAENNIAILPVTLKYDTKIGVNREDKVDLNSWFNTNVKMYIHEPIFNNNWMTLKENVFNKIREPLI